MIIVLFGAPGVGKGTQAALLSERKNIPHLSTGEALRQAIAAQTELGRVAKQIVESGQLVSDEIVTGIVKEAMDKPEYSNGCIFDGFPRNQSQAEALDSLLEAVGKEIDSVINIKVANEEIVDRMLKRGRKDDSEEVIRHRLDIYNNQTAPLLDYYTNHGKLISIDGNADVEEVYARIENIL
ncbi:MAG: adenylate kinase [Ignavibacteriae bacterium]|nr:adenylate kinase [Ignavibacteriota bacterium]